ncbi:MAG: asparaginase [Planctomycetota bacterium]
MKRVCIIHTGGTIGMRMSERGLMPEPGYLAAQMEKMSELFEGMLPEFEVLEYEPLIDSSNLTPDHWQQIAQDIKSNYHRFDGFVVLHGTDSMAYTSSILPFMLEGLNKSVVVTGAQLPLGQVRNDARENLKTAMMLAAGYHIPEVTLFFGEVLLRGCRATKSSATKLDAFESPNYPVLGSVETNIEIFNRRIRFPETADDKLTVHQIKPVEIATFRLFPGMSIDVLKNVLLRPLKALIIESYGVGNGPADNPRFIEAIQSAVDDGIVIVNCTQCGHGCVAQTSYATGTALSDAGVVSGRDMTVEAAIAKLYYLFSRDLSVSEIRNSVPQDLVGELTEQSSN